jgi:hypothetical protein
MDWQASGAFKKKKRVNLRKKRARSYKVTLNALIIRNKGITQKTAIRSLNRMRQLKRRLRL